ncbi:MAG: ATP-dependent helicase [Chloroflexi bacterium]|nr:ATP-dependent helicase [Chloroflexota bacterium]
MDSFTPPLSLLQQQIVESPLDIKLFVRGKAGTGKTTAGVERMRHLLAQSVPADSILMLTPQRTLQEPYLELLYSPERSAGGEVTSATIGGLARRMCDLFWPIAAESAGFKNPQLPPAFLTLETAQYYMAHLARPLIEEQGYFQSLTINRNRLYSQIIDGLNKAALVGFPYIEIATRLDSAWFGDPAQRRIYADVQKCASAFREHCLENNLLDFSLQLELFTDILWPHPQVREYLSSQYQHLIYDNVEEDTPRAHDIVHEWMNDFQSALLIYDDDAGYRNFLGGDAVTGAALSADCDHVISFDESFVSSESIIELSDGLVSAILSTERQIPEPRGERAFEILTSRFYPEMLDQVVGKIMQLLNSGMPPSEIVVLAPYLSDALRFSITNRLEEKKIPWRTNRPSRSLRDETASQTLLTLSALAHPHWNVHPNKYDVAHALMFALNTDLVRAQLLTDIIYRQKDIKLSTFEEINPEMQERITYALGERYANLRMWLMNYREDAPLPLDFYMRKLFGEVISQSGYGFHENMDAVRIAASLIESIKKFRNAMENQDLSGFDLGREYLTMLADGVIAAQYLESWRSENKDAVLVAPAYTFLMMNRPATVQIWIDPGSSGWVERLSQPLTHPYVLSREWEQGKLWMDSDEVTNETDSLARLVGGLLSRCRERIILAMSDLGESGFEGRGVLLRAFQKVLQQDNH